MTDDYADLRTRAEQAVAAGGDWFATEDLVPILALLDEREHERVLLDGYRQTIGYNAACEHCQPVTPASPPASDQPHEFQTGDLGNPTYEWCVCGEHRSQPIHVGTRRSAPRTAAGKQAALIAAVDACIESGRTYQYGKVTLDADAFDDLLMLATEIAVGKAEAAAGSGSLDVREALRFLGPDPVLADGSLWTIDELVEKVTAALAATSASDQEAEDG